MYQAPETLHYNSIWEVLQLASKMSPRDPVLLFTSLCSPFPHCARIGLCDQQNMALMMVCHLQIRLQKTLWLPSQVLSHFPSQIFYFGRNQLPCCWRLMGEELRPLPTTMQVNQEVDFPAPVKPSDNYSLSRQLDCNHMRDRELQPPSQATLILLTLSNCVE